MKTIKKTKKEKKKGTRTRIQPISVRINVMDSDGTPMSGFIDFISKGPNNIYYSIMSYNFVKNNNQYLFSPREQLDWNYTFLKDDLIETNERLEFITAQLKEVVGSFDRFGKKHKHPYFKLGDGKTPNVITVESNVIRLTIE